MKAKILLVLILTVVCVWPVFCQTQYEPMTGAKFFEIAMAEINKMTTNYYFMQFSTMQTGAGMDKDGKCDTWMLDVIASDGFIYRAMLYTGYFYVQQLPASGSYSQYKITADMLDTAKIFQAALNAGAKEYLTGATSVYADLMAGKGPNGAWQWWLTIRHPEKGRFYVYINPATYEVVGTSN